MNDIDYSPAFLTFGVDLALRVASAWHTPAFTKDSERRKLLNEVRQETVLRTVSLRQSRAEKMNRALRPRNIEVGDWILFTMRPGDHDREDPDFKHTKLASKWTMPYQVIEVDAARARLAARSVNDGSLREDHLSQVRLIGSPVTKEQHD